PRAERARVGRRARAPLRHQVIDRDLAERDVALLARGVAAEVPGARPAAVMAERGQHHAAAEPALAHREREVLVEAVIEAVALVEAADRIEQRARETHA